MMNSPICILYINGGTMDRGGISSFMMNYYQYFDHTKIHIDFVVHGTENCFVDEIESLGGTIYVLPQKSKHPFLYNQALKRILTDINYEIIHTHNDAMGAQVLKIAKMCDVSIRIAHSHNTKHLTNNPIKLFFLGNARRHINKYATHRLACSEIAGKWLFGSESFQIVRNAINIDNFFFKETVRKSVRKEWNVKNNFVIGHVGRFDTQKNHSFLLDVFANIHKHFHNTKLILVGDGHLKKNIVEKINKLQIEDAVILVGERSDVEIFYNAFDLFVLPSLFEGLGIVAIEAEVNGCPVLLSSKVPEEAKIAKNVDFLPLDKKCWIERISQIITEHPKRMAAKFDYANSGYDVKIEAKKLQQFYLDL